MDEVISGLFAEGIDIKGAAACQVSETGVQLSRAEAGVGAAPVGVVLLGGCQGSAAFGADAGVDELALFACAGILHGAQNLRDHLSGLADHDGISQPDALAMGLRWVVQGGHGNRGTCHILGLHHRVRSGAAGAADAHADIPQDRQRFLRRVLVCDCPARGAAGGAQLQLFL